RPRRCQIAINAAAIYQMMVPPRALRAAAITASSRVGGRSGFSASPPAGPSEPRAEATRARIRPEGRARRGAGPDELARGASERVVIAHFLQHRPIFPGRLRVRGDI